MHPEGKEPTRRPITRRAALAAFGTVSLGVLLEACTGDPETSVTSAPIRTSDGSTATVQPQSPAGSDLAAMFDDAATCSLSPEGTEGPFYFDVDSIRTNIVEDREGTPLRLGIRVQEAGDCTALANAVVDVWHCDAEGSYSGFEAASQGGGFSGGPTDEETYLRGAQVTNADGIAEFRTVYPGWYPGRTVHIHAKVHLDSATVLTTQLYFEDGVTDAVFTAEPYASSGPRTTLNGADGIFDPATVLTVIEDDDGYLGLITIGVER
jgi:protocatechuate 3,4-dioxygenase beta subunit